MAQILMYENKPFSAVISSGGHTIKNDSGTELSQRDKLQFKGIYTHDDSTNGQTVAEIVREFNSVDDIEELTGEEAKGIQVVLNSESYIPTTASDIDFDKTGTSFTGNDVDGVLREIDSSLDGLSLKEYTLESRDSDITLDYGKCIQIGKLVFVDIIITTSASKTSASPLVYGFPEVIAQDSFQIWGTEIKAYPNFSTTPIGFRFYYSGSACRIYSNVSLSAGQYHICGSYIAS